jgi:diguanylate cyclase (GGDEF)-like protein
LNVLSKPFDLAGSVEKVYFHVTRRSGPPSPGHDLLWDLLRDALVDRTREFYQSIDAYERQLRPVLVENERLRNLAMRDHLTGLLNRRGMYEHLEQIALPRSLAFVDLDDLSELNKLDERWEDGDAAIAGLADRLRDAFGDENVARWGGDEFLLVSPTGSAEEAADLLRRILEECQTELVISGRPITFSAGVTDCSGGLEAARPRAEEAVSTAKQKKATIVCAD